MQFEPEQSLKYSYWSNFSGQPNVPENYQVVSFLLEEPDGQGKTVLSLTQENCKSEETREHSEKNWTMVLGMMKEMVEKS